MQAEYLPKIRNAITRAISLLDQSLAGQKTENSRSLREALWHVSEETEYAAAVLSLSHGLTDFDPELREIGLKKMVMEGQASFARTLLCDSLALLGSNPKLSYEKLRHAVQILRKIQAQIS